MWISVVRHEFSSDVFERYAKSYYHPCGHPWAALVLFDAVLVTITNIHTHIHIHIHIYISIHSHTYEQTYEYTHIHA